jgi:hypothetical protein
MKLKSGNRVGEKYREVQTSILKIKDMVDSYPEH